MKTIASAMLLLALPLVGCASVPRPVAAPTGEPLSVREHTETGYVTEKVKVGEVEHKGTNGQTYGKSEIYQNQTRSFEYQVWGGYQGDVKVSDDDFYRISNDQKAIQDVQDKREGGVVMNRVGLGLLALGAAGVVGGYAINSSWEPDANNPGATAPKTGLYIVTGGLITAAVGGILTWVGLSKAHSEHPLTQDRAQAAAANYNRTIGAGPTTTMTTGFALP